MYIIFIKMIIVKVYKLENTELVDTKPGINTFF